MALYIIGAILFVVLVFLFEGAISYLVNEGRSDGNYLGTIFVLTAPLGILIILFALVGYPIYRLGQIIGEAFCVRFLNDDTEDPKVPDEDLSLDPELVKKAYEPQEESIPESEGSFVGEEESNLPVNVAEPLTEEEDESFHPSGPHKMSLPWEDPKPKTFSAIRN